MSLPPSPPPPPPYSSSFIGTNTDILTEILTYLPATTLLRFKSVNKQFNSVINHPSFSLLHSLRHPNPPPSALFLLLHPHSSSPVFPSFSFVPLAPFSSPPLPPVLPYSPSDIVQSCNGLFLLTTENIIAGFENDSHDAMSGSPGFGKELETVVISNPTTRETTRVITGDCHEEGEVVGLSLAFDVSKWRHYYILKVSKSGENRFEIRVFGSDTSDWRDDVVSLEDVPFDTEFDRGVYWKGRVFWLSHTGWMIYYDIENGVVGKLGLPKVFDDDTYLERFRYFGESCGHLHLIEIRTNCVREFDVLELEEKEGGVLEWCVKFRLDLDVVGCGFEYDMFQDGIDRFGRRLRFYGFSILGVVCRNKGYGDDDEDVLVLSIPGKVISYSFKSNVSRLLCDVQDECDKWFPFRGCNAFQFIESLYRL